MSDQVIITPKRTHAVRISGTERSETPDQEGRVRLYNEHDNGIHGQLWAIQVSGRLRLTSGAASRDFVIAHASMRREDLEALGRAIDRALNHGEAT